MFPQMTKCCHTDDITFKLWQPLPPYIMDKDGHRFAGHILWYSVRNNFCVKAAWYPTVWWIRLQWTGWSKMLGDKLCSCNDHFQSNYDFLSFLFRKKSLLIRPREYIFVQISGEQISFVKLLVPVPVLTWSYLDCDLCSSFISSQLWSQ